MLHVRIIDDWRCDQYRWTNQGVTKLPRKPQPKIKKHYFHASTPEGISKDFQKHAYQLLNNENLTLIHYLGDESIATTYPHGNNIHHPESTFIRTCPSTMSALGASLKTEKASVLYKKSVASMNTSPELVPVVVPRNMQQLRSMRHRVLQKSRISHDEIFNIHELAYDMPGYIHKIITFPDLVCVCGMTELLEECDRVLFVGSDQQIVSYDTTFQLGDFYVTFSLA